MRRHLFRRIEKAVTEQTGGENKRKFLYIFDSESF